MAHTLREMSDSQLQSLKQSMTSGGLRDMSDAQLQKLKSQHSPQKQDHRLPSLMETAKETPQDISSWFSQQANLIPLATGNIVNAGEALLRGGKPTSGLGDLIKSDIIKQPEGKTDRQDRANQFGQMGQDALRTALMAATPGIKGMRGGAIGAAAGRVIPQMASAAVTSKNPGKEALVTGLVNSLFEGIPLAGKLLKKMDPDALTGKIATKVRNIYKGASTRAKSLYSELQTQLGPKRITSSSNSSKFHGMNDDDLSLLSRDTRNSVNGFEKDPTYNNAHRLQSDMFQDAAREGRAQNFTTSNNIHSMRQQFNNSIKKWMTKNYPNAVPFHNEARDLTRDIIKPSESSSVLNSISTGAVKPNLVNPSEVSSAMKAFERSKKISKTVKKDHPFTALAEELRKHKKESSLYKSAVDLGGAIGGGLIGHNLFPYGGISGLGAGAALTHYLSSPVAKLTSPIISSLEKLEPGYLMARKGASALSPSVSK